MGIQYGNSVTILILSCYTNCRDEVLQLPVMKQKVLILVSAVLFLGGSIRGQCLDRDSLRNRIIYLSGPIKLPLKEKLAELFGYLQNMNACPYKNDSTHELLLRGIGAIYYDQSDFLNAAKYLRQSIDIITANAGKPAVNMKQLPTNYYYLSLFYNSLNNVTEELRSLDSCATIGRRLKLVNRAILIALYKRVEYFFDVGDYHRCISYAIMCETLSRDYAKNCPKHEFKTALEHISTSLAWHVRALLTLENYESAETLLADKVDEYKKAGLKNLGVIYGQLADVQMNKGNFKKALSFLNQELEYEHKAGYDFNYKQTLNRIGYDVYFRHFNDGDRALVFYRNALKQTNKDKSWDKADTVETLNILSNIAKVYVQKGAYDSAFRYFQLAFDQIQKGSNEITLLHGSTKDITTFKKMHYITSLVIDKGDAYRQQYISTKQTNALREAIRIYKAADQLLNRVKAGLSDLKSKLFWRSDSRRLYENAIEACYLRNNADDAFYFFEKSRAVLLNDQLNEQRWLGEEDIMKQTQIQKNTSSGKRIWHY